MSNADKNTNKQTGPSLAQSILVCAGLVILALAARAVVYFRVENVLHAEEAVQGLMARHILGGSVQLFTYGLPYLGTLQAHLVALCFALLGSSVAVLKWAAAMDSLLLVAANYLLAREVAGGDHRAGRIAAFLTAIGPLYLLEWSLRPRGGHLEVATLSALAFWALLRALRAGHGQDARATTRWLALCAFLLGVGWWVHLTMFYAIAACAIAIAAWGRRLRGDLRAVVVAIFCFMVGSLPFWLYNVKYPGQTFRWLWVAFSARRGPIGFFDRLAESVPVTVPVLLGSRQTEAAQSFGAMMVALSLVAYAVAIWAAIAAIRRQKADAESCRENPTPSREGIALLLIFSAIALVVFVIGPSFPQAKDPRALLSLYGALSPLAAVGITQWWTGGRTKHQAAVLVLIALAIVHVNGYRRAERDVVQPRVQGQPVPVSLEPLKLFLEATGTNLIYSNFYVGYRLGFETGESMIACTDGDPWPEPYPLYAERVRVADRPVPLIVTARMAEWLEADLKKHGIGCEVTTVQDFRVFYNLTAPYRAYPPGPKLCVPAKIEVGKYPKQCQPGAMFSVQVAVTNESSIAWPEPTTWRTVELSYHLLDPQTGRMSRYENPRFSLGKPVGQGESTTVTMDVKVPNVPGRCAFVPDLVIEAIAWLSTFQSDLRDKPNWHEFSVGPGR